jgi:hypothetical protein
VSERSWILLAWTGAAGNKWLGGVIRKRSECPRGSEARGSPKPHRRPQGSHRALSHDLGTAGRCKKRVLRCLTAGLADRPRATVDVVGTSWEARTALRRAIKREPDETNGVVC